MPSSGSAGCAAPPVPDAPTVIVADACEHGRRRVRDILNRAGLRRIYEAADGAEAVGLLGAVSPDLLVLDWNLPVIGAAEIIRLSKGSPRSGGLPLVVTMANPVRDTVGQALELGVTRIVVKPFSARALSSRVAQLLADSL